MAILSDFIDNPTDLGSSPSQSHSETERLITDQAFSPQIGTCYEIHFGQVTIGEKSGYGSARIRAEGELCSEWIDLDTGAPLDNCFCQYVVEAFREITCPRQARKDDA
jgi:hypothetical protein